MTIDARITSGEAAIELALVDDRPDTVALFADLDEGRRRQLATDAWSIGLRAISNAYATARESRLEDIGRDVLTGLEHTLDHQLEGQRQALDAALARFFDPEDGKVHERLDHFMADQGVLERQLEKYLAPDHGVIARTLADQLGRNSPLLRRLSTTDSEGLVKTIEAQVTEVMAKSRGEFDRALDPSRPESPISLFLGRLKGELESSSAALDGKLATALSALDANREDSLLSRLVRDTREAQSAVLKAMNPEAEDSPLGLMGASLRRVVEESTRSQRELLEHQRQRQQTFETEVKTALERIETKGRMEDRTTLGGFDFERGVIAHVEAAGRSLPCRVSSTGEQAGALSRCKVGDVVLEFTAESAFAGNRVVVEAKRDRSYSIDKALNEMKIARENRAADVGVFVMASSRAKNADFPVLARHGADVLVQWDENDPGTDVNLRAALMLAIGLVARAKAPREEGNIEAMNDVESRITSELARIVKTRGFNDTIMKNAGKVENELRVATRKLEILLERAQSTLRALGVDVLAHELAAEEPVVFHEDDAAMRVTTVAGTTGDEPPARIAVVDPSGNPDFVVAQDDGFRGARIIDDPATMPPGAANEGSTEADLTRFLDALAACPDGSSGNISLSRRVGWDQRRYDAARDMAVDRGLVGVGPGRGGVVYLVRKGTG